MENFRFYNPTEIIFGRATESLAGKEIKKYSSKVLVVYGGDTIKKIGLYSRVLNSLQEEQISFFELSGVVPNPVISKVKEGIDICRENGIDFILAIGGGSVIDTAKAIAIGAPFEGDPWDFFMGKARPVRSLSLGVILTVTGAGSEASLVTVITNEKTKLKKGFHTHLFLPKFSILNPELTFSISPFQTACGAGDTMAHIMERYFSNTPKADLTDRLCEGAMKTVIDNTPLVLAVPGDYDARAELMWTSTLAHNGILGTGRIEDWASHKLGHELSAVFGVSHGASLSVIFPAWMKYVYKQNIKKFLQFSSRVWGIDPASGTAEEIALKGIQKLAGFFRDIGLPTTLGELKIPDIPDPVFEEMSAKELQWGPIGNYIKLNQEDLVKIFKLAR